MALTPNYLQKCTDGIERQYQQLVTEILVDLADRISHAQGMTSTAEYLNEKLREMSLHQVWINQMLAKVLNTTEKDVEKLMEESTYKSTRSEIKNLEAHGYDTSGLEFAAQIEKSTNVAKNELTNLTRTTGQLATSKLMNIYDQAYLQVSTGAYSYDQAVTNAVKKLAKDGLGEVTYPTGAKRTVEAAVRVAVRTSVSQNALKCEEDMLDDMDVNLVEVSSHLGARPSHAVWQGKIYWRKHPEGNYENFYEATGYGTPTGLGGYNCRHQHYAYFGEDDEQAYHHIDETLNKEAYEMEQKQRSLERKLREWDRKEKILNAGGVDSTEAKRWKSYYKKKLDEHVKSSHGFLKRDYAAEKAWSAPDKKKASAKPKQLEQAMLSGRDLYAKRLNPPAPRIKVGDLDPDIFAVQDLQTREVILMKEREEHIKERHPEAYEDIMANLSTLITSPDLVMEDTKKPGTRWAILKLSNANIRVVVRLSTTANTAGYKNSIITGQYLTEERLGKYIKGKRYIIVYKKQK